MHPFMRQLMQEHRRLLDNITSLMALQWLNYLIPLVTLPYLVRTLGLPGYGRMAVAQAFVSYFVLIVNYGFDLSATHSIALNRDDVMQTSRIFSAVLTAKLGLLIFCILLALPLIVCTPTFHANVSLYLICLLAVPNAVLMPGWLFQGLERIKLLSYISMGGSILYFLGTFAFVHTQKDLLLAALIPNLSGFFVCCTGLGLTPRLGARLVRPSMLDIRNLMAEGFSLFLASAAISLYTATNVFLVGLIAGDAAAGVFNAADKITRAVQGLIAPVSQATFPHICALVIDSQERAAHFIRKLLVLQGGAMLIPSLLLLAMPEQIVRLILGAAAMGAVPVLRWMSLLPFLIAVSNVLGIQTMVTHHMRRPFSTILLTGGVLNVTLCLSTIPALGGSGAAVSVLLTEIFITASMAIVIRYSGVLRLQRV